MTIHPTNVAAKEVCSPVAASAKLTAEQAAQLNAKYPKGIAAWMHDLDFKSIDKFMTIRTRCWPAA